jgi:hypothetical protein
MASALIRRDQFQITPEGITHKPTDAGFTPYPGDAKSGILRLGQLGNGAPNDHEYCSGEVQRIMHELWAEYVLANPRFFR